MDTLHLPEAPQFNFERVELSLSPHNGQVQQRERIRHLDFSLMRLYGFNRYTVEHRLQSFLSMPHRYRTAMLQPQLNPFSVSRYFDRAPVPVFSLQQPLIPYLSRPNHQVPLSMTRSWQVTDSIIFKSRQSVLGRTFRNTLEWLVPAAQARVLTPINPITHPRTPVMMSPPVSMNVDSGVWESLTNFASFFCGDRTGELARLRQGSFRKLTDEQLGILCNEIDQSLPLTTKSICAYVKEQFNIIYSIGGMTDLLRREGYVYKKPKLAPANPDINAQEAFLEYYNNFMDTKSDNDAVFFVDAVHPVHNSMPAYGWIKRGTEKELKSNSGRSRLNIQGAMNAETYETTILATEGSIDSETTIDLLKALEKSHPLADTIFIILDNARYHYSKSVQEYLKTSKVKLVFQPPYSPELNLIERLWRLFKKRVLYNRFYEKFDDFKKACMIFFKNQDKHHDDIVSIMGEGLAGLA